jgi:Tfp pilus assembly protein PilF
MTLANRRSCGLDVAVAVLFIALASAGCSSPGDVGTGGSTAMSKAKHPRPRVASTSRAESALRRGIDSYEDAEYELAVREIRSALDRGLGSRADQAKAYKYLAFIACASDRLESCHAQFRNALEIDPNFDLAPAEAGHPIWGPVFREARLEVKGKAAKR